MTLDIDYWISHFEMNRMNRREPDWQAPMTLDDETIRPLLRSLEQFHLGDGGGPAYLIAGNRETLLSKSEGMRKLVDLWFREEKEHSRLLGMAVRRFHGKPITGHWSFSAFCASRRILGVNFELTVLLLTEIASTSYYRLLRRHTEDLSVRQMCKLILRDEAGHIAFHCDRLASEDRTYGQWWESRFRFLGYCAATMLWVNHARAVKAVGGSTAEFYHELDVELDRFVRNLRSGGAPRRTFSRSRAGRLATQSAPQLSAHSQDGPLAQTPRDAA